MPVWLQVNVEMLQESAKFIATFCCGIFAGAATYINLVEHPARMECGSELALKEFEPSYRKATIMQASLAAVGFVCSAVAWLSGAGMWWLSAGILFGLVIPITLLIILPVNKQLLAPNLDKQSARARELLVRWNRLHAIRTVLSTIALIIFLLNY